MANYLIFLVAVVAALGGMIYGFDSGIVATTLGHDTFKVYMYGPSMSNPALSGKSSCAIVSVYNAGQSVGGLSTGFMADKISRKYTIFVAAFLTVVGAILQCAAVNVGMMIAGRLIAGMGCGQILSIVPIYLAEVSPPKTRGFLVGLQGMLISIGFALANWVGYAGSFASGDAQWRIPLAMQLPVPVFLMGAIFFIPFTPRWLVQQDRADEARQVLQRLHGGDSNYLANQELVQIREQINLERAQGNMNWLVALSKMFSRQYVRRTLTAAFIIAMGQLSGSSVIQNFQNIFYAAVGFTGKTSLLISGAYGMMGVIGQVIYLTVVADRWPRTTTLWSGSLVLSCMISICMALSSQYGSTSNENQTGARAAIAFIFLYSMSYAIFFNSMACLTEIPLPAVFRDETLTPVLQIWVVPSELFPFFLRSKGLAFAVFVKAVVAIVLSQITPIALAHVGWRSEYHPIPLQHRDELTFYVQSGKSIEEIAELFGDTLATNHIGEIDVDAKAAAPSTVEHVEEYDLEESARKG
ncbi:hypothetical protein A1O1_05690 [Capronia coronata CBS 617.96]|uniref:Major facilitator superfamily (MFS) profile domain-containing protein n=1 Tax=Capronia coronata CBS 617.96 TaxID=1182541 RepID=W9Y7V2_9EURO|nr:uncharacterized protein A1O1_05690 [Capronia coronata CBS 617.96]EXJ85326.1 hypothetical protein A1O1_05690 [Capronia coronata CBS 617.96]